MLEVTNLRSGAVLSHLDGEEKEDRLIVPVEGLSDPHTIVTINGERAEKRDRHFSGKAVITRKVDEIRVVSDGPYGETTLKLTVMWDKKSFRRFSFFIDDNSFFWTDILKNRPKSLFDQFYLDALRKIHEKYGTKFCLNCFFQNDHDPAKPTLKEFPETYKSQFEDNSSWLRLAFHAYSEFPDRPYQHVPAEKLAGDYDLLKEEISRIAGEKSFIAAPVIHWAITNPANLKVLKERGVNTLTGAFLTSRTSVDVAPTFPVEDVGYFASCDTAEYIASGKLYYDKFTGILFSGNAGCCNYDDISAWDERMPLLTDPASPRFRETLSLMTHEQYSFPFYCNYIANHFERMDHACKLAAEAGYVPVFLPEGILGNTAWNE